MFPSLEHEIYELHSRLCSGLADPKRILILYALSERTQRVTDLCQSLGFPQSSVSRQLKNLRDRGMVIAKREGQSVYYHLSDQRIIQALDLMRAVLADQLASQASLAQSVGELDKT
jgi:ArsR family transcriptional regulator